MRVTLGRWRAALLSGGLLSGPALLLLTGLTFLAITTLTWRGLEGRSDFIQFLALLVEVAAFALPFFGPLDPPPGRVFWGKLQANGRWQAVLAALTVSLWATLFLWTGPVRLVPGDLSTYTVDNLCALAIEHPSEGALQTFLVDRAAQEAQAHFGGSQQVRPLGSPDFYAGENLSQVCIRVTFDNGAAGQ